MKKIYIYLFALSGIYSGTAQAQEPGLVDYDGNVYDTVQIGNQLWMAENLRVTHYQNGIPIPNVTDDANWGSLTLGARCYYNNDSASIDSVYGPLYNWRAVNDTNGLCPQGWHVPTDDEWVEVETFLGGWMVAGGEMKEQGTLHWLPPNAGATNSSGFTGLPGGFRGMDNEFSYLQENGLWWTSTATGPTNAWSRYLWYMNTGVDRNPTPKTAGFSIRCIMDSQVGIIETIPSRSFVYPNPASDHIIVEAIPDGQFYILNLNGCQLIQQQIINQKTTVDVSNLQKGIYFLKIVAKGGVQTGKLVKQ